MDGDPPANDPSDETPPADDDGNEDEPPASPRPNTVNGDPNGDGDDGEADEPSDDSADESDTATEISSAAGSSDAFDVEPDFGAADQDPTPPAEDDDGNHEGPDDDAAETGVDGESEADTAAVAPEADEAEAAEADYTAGSSPYAGIEGPSEDQEMPLAEHIEEMLKRLAVIIAVAGIVSLVTFPVAEQLINFLWNSILPAGELTRPRLYGILELKLTELKVASLAGLIVALPVLVHQTYQFMRPGLYPHERRYYLAAIPTSLVLALIGVSFAYFIILPAIFTYFLYYSRDVATIGFALGRTFDLILILMGYLAIVFQIPLFIMLAMMMGLVTRQWLADRRILFWGGFLGLSFIFSPDPTGMAPIVVALTMVVLFEGTLLLAKWTKRS